MSVTEKAKKNRFRAVANIPPGRHSIFGITQTSLPLTLSILIFVVSQIPGTFHPNCQLLLRPGIPLEALQGVGAVGADLPAYAERLMKLNICVGPSRV